MFHRTLFFIVALSLLTAGCGGWGISGHAYGRHEGRHEHHDRR